MKHNTLGRRLCSGIITAAMAVSTSLSVMPLEASAEGQLLGQTDFDNGVGLPWHTCVIPPAKLDFEIRNGSYNIMILNNGGQDVGGESRWDCQFRHRKLRFRQGNKYSVHAEMTASNDGEIYTKIGDLSGDIEIWHNGYGKDDNINFNQNWCCMPVEADEPLVIDSTFTATETLDVAEWAWYFGGAGPHQSVDCFPEGTVLKFDNMSLIDLDGEGVCPQTVPPPYMFQGNQVGYFTEQTKKANFHSDKKSDSTEVYVVNAKTKETVWEGKVTVSDELDKDSGMFCGTFDFSELTAPGTYFFSPDGETQNSYEFEIGDDIYDSIVKDSLNFFYQNRSGIDIEEKYIASLGDNNSKKALAHMAGHEPDTAYLQTEWVKTYSADGEDVETESGTLTATGGWEDAGNFTKSVINGCSALWTLQNLYEWNQKMGIVGSGVSTENKFEDSSDFMQIPEANNKYPDLLDEGRYELEWLFDMMVGKDYKPDFKANKFVKDTGKYENMVYTQIQDNKWTGLAVKSWDYVDEWGTRRIVRPPSVNATLNLAACAAQAARLWKDYDESFAALCLENAKKAYAAAKANPSLFAPNMEAIGTDLVQDGDADDEFYWAATELYLTTGSKDYLADMKDSQFYDSFPSVLNDCEHTGAASSFSKFSTAALGQFSMLVNANVIGSEQYEKLSASLLDAADEYLKMTQEQPFGIPYKTEKFEDVLNIGSTVMNGYGFGSNGIALNNAMVMAYAASVTNNREYLDGVTSAVDYLFGRNPMDISYVTGYGTYHAVNPHHKWWSHELDGNFPYAPSGVVVSGPNSGLQDDFVRGAGLQRFDNNPPQLCYYDSIEAWSVNECGLEFNAPLAWVMSFVEDSFAIKTKKVDPIETEPIDESETTTTTTTTTTTAKIDPIETESNYATETSTSMELTSTTTTTTTMAVKEGVSRKEGLIGDVSGNGKVGIEDVIILSRYVANDPVYVSESGVILAECDGDDVLSMDDVAMMLQYIARIIKAFPIA